MTGINQDGKTFPSDTVKSENRSTLARALQKLGGKSYTRRLIQNLPAGWGERRGYVTTQKQVSMRSPQKKKKTKQLDGSKEKPVCGDKGGGKQNDLG